MSQDAVRIEIHRIMIPMVGLTPLFHFYSLRIDVLMQYFSNFNVLTNHTGILLWSSFWFRMSRVGLRFWFKQAPTWGPCRWCMDPILSNKAIVWEKKHTLCLPTRNLQLKWENQSGKDTRSNTAKQYIAKLTHAIEIRTGKVICFLESVGRLLGEDGTGTYWLWICACEYQKTGWRMVFSNDFAKVVYMDHDPRVRNWKLRSLLGQWNKWRTFNIYICM